MTRVLVAAYETNEESVALVDAWRERGIDADLTPPHEVRRRLRSGDVVLGRLDVLRTVDGVEPGLLDLFLLERSGVRVLNPAWALLGVHDKLQTTHRLRRARLPYPAARHLSPREPLPPLEPPLVLKPRFGSWGTDVCWCQTGDELERCLAEASGRSWFRRHGALAQDFVEPRGHDLRVLVAGGTVVGALERVARAGEWRTNISLGGAGRPAIPSPKAAALALTAVAAVGGDLVGVDLLPLDGGYVVLELNGAVEFDASYSLPGRDVYEDAAAALGLQPAWARRRAVALG